MGAPARGGSMHRGRANATLAKRRERGQGAGWTSARDAEARARLRRDPQLVDHALEGVDRRMRDAVAGLEVAAEVAELAGVEVVADEERRRALADLRAGRVLRVEL